MKQYFWDVIDTIDKTVTQSSKTTPHVLHIFIFYIYPCFNRDEAANDVKQKHYAENCNAKARKILRL